MKKNVELFNELYKGYDYDIFSELSIKERRKKRINNKDFIYGEILHLEFTKLLYFIEREENKKFEGDFLDLGSGSGKAVFTSALFNNRFANSVGVEFLDDLYLESETIALKYNFLKVEQQQISTNVAFLHGDYLEVDLMPYNVVFSNSTCMEKSNLLRLLANAEQMLKRNSYLIVTDQYLPLKPNSSLKLLSNIFVQMTFGLSRAIIYKML